MVTQHEELSDLSARLLYLESQNRRIKRAALVGLAVVGCGVLMGATGFRQQSIDVQTLTLSDATGKVRCRLEVDDEGNVAQTFMDRLGTERIRLVVDQEGIARFRMFDDEGSLRVGAVTFPGAFKGAPSQAGLSVLGYGNKSGTSENGGIFLRTTRNGIADQAVYDKSGNQRIGIGSFVEDNLSEVEIYGKDKDHLSSIQLGTLDNGTAFQQFFGANGKRRIQLNTGQQGEASQFFFDAEEKNRLNVGILPSGVLVQNWLDKNETTRMRMVVVPSGTARDGIAADGYAAQLFFDKNGQLRVDTSTYGDGQASTDYRDLAGNRRLSLAMFPNYESLVRHYDARGAVRQYNGTYANGESGHAILGQDGTTKFSAMVNSDNSLSYYQDKSVAVRAWEATGNVLQLLDLGKRLGIIGSQNR